MKLPEHNNPITATETIHKDGITRVVHLKKEKYDVLIGRPSKWGNPFTMGKDCSRREAVAKYADWLDGMTHNKLLDLNELQGKDLVCWCSPLPCHADVLLELASK